MDKPLLHIINVVNVEWAVKPQNEDARFPCYMHASQQTNYSETSLGDHLRQRPFFFMELNSFP